MVTAAPGSAATIIRSISSAAIAIGSGSAGHELAARLDGAFLQLGADLRFVDIAARLRQIAQQKLADVNALDIEAAEKIIAGTARSMGIEVEG